MQTIMLSSRGIVSFLPSGLDVFSFHADNPEQSGESRHPCLVQRDTISVLVAVLPSLGQCGQVPGEGTRPGRPSGACRSKAAARAGRGPG